MDRRELTKLAEDAVYVAFEISNKSILNYWQHHHVNANLSEIMAVVKRETIEGKLNQIMDYYYSLENQINDLIADLSPSSDQAIELNCALEFLNDCFTRLNRV